MSASTFVIFSTYNKARDMSVMIITGCRELYMDFTVLMPVSFYGLIL